VYVAARNNSYEIMQALLAKGADSHSVNANGERLLALCKPLAAAALYEFVRASAAVPSDTTLVGLFPEFKLREGETSEPIVTQLVSLLELLNEGLQLYMDRRQVLEELKQLVVTHVTGNTKDKIPRDMLSQNTKQLSFSSLSPDELAALKNKRKSNPDADHDAEEEAEAKAENGLTTKKARVADEGDEDEAKKEEKEAEAEEEVIEEPDIGTLLTDTNVAYT
jgi:hypothetical protein